MGAASLALGAGAAAMLRIAQKSPRGRGGLWAACGWVALILAAALMSLWLGAGIGVAATALTFSLSGYLALLLGVERRADRMRSPRSAEPELRPRAWKRGWARGVAALFLAAFASVAIGAASAGIPLGSPADRVTVGAMIVPFLWAAFVVWMLADRSIRRPVIGMTGALAVAAAGITWSVLS